MTDVTADFNVCLQERGNQPVLRREYDFQTINSFLQEAYNIVWPPIHKRMACKLLT